MSQLIQSLEWQQQQDQSLEFAGDTSQRPLCTPRYRLDHPMSFFPDSRIAARSTVNRLDLLDIPQLLLHQAAVATVVPITPCLNCSGVQNGSQSQWLGLMDIPQLRWHRITASALSGITPCQSLRPLHMERKCRRSGSGSHLDGLHKRKHGVPV